MKKYFVDLHIHIGASADLKPVKITASRLLTLQNIMDESKNRKGLDIIGIVDCASPGVINDIKDLLDRGVLTEIADGGWSYLNKLTVIPGVEVESKEKSGKQGHFLCYFPSLNEIELFSSFLNKYISNLQLSTQQTYLPANELLKVTKSLGGFFIPAHAFTPYKSLYGSCANSIKDLFKENSKEIKAIELGLSADTNMADRISELSKVTFLSNSDAHSLGKIGREYNVIEMSKPTFKNLVKALCNKEGKVVANYGLDPALGKYYRSFCDNCEKSLINKDSQHCPFCSSQRITKGVLDRILEISSQKSCSPVCRPEYYHQVPLSFIPNVGMKTIDKLLQEFGSEMRVLHNVTQEELEKIINKDIANMIMLSRKGKLSIICGGGGKYGKVKEKNGNYLK